MWGNSSLVFIPISSIIEYVSSVLIFMSPVLDLSVLHMFASTLSAADYALPLGSETSNIDHKLYQFRTRTLVFFQTSTFGFARRKGLNFWLVSIVCVTLSDHTVSTSQCHLRVDETTGKSMFSVWTVGLTLSY